jgi:hypothetical protein
LEQQVGIGAPNEISAITFEELCDAGGDRACHWIGL